MHGGGGNVSRSDLRQLRVAAPRRAPSLPSLQPGRCALAAARFAAARTPPHARRRGQENKNVLRLALQRRRRRVAPLPELSGCWKGFGPWPGLVYATGIFTAYMVASKLLKKDHGDHH